jgi:EAL domain-containing protein (putative c-di-GMP-specific phosphodiesterase class I)
MNSNGEATSDHGASIAQDREAIEAASSPGGLTMLHQPIVDLISGELVGVEALARFRSPPKRSPEKWFEAAGRVGLRTELERRAVTVATSGLPNVPIGCFMSVNASPDTVLDPAFAKQLARVDVHRIVLEVTEQARIDSYERFADALAPLRTRGLRLAVDDLGSGFASLSHLLRLEPDLIKLDRSLTRDIDRHRPTRALAAALTAFAMETGTLVLAEGIETTVQRSLLIALGVSLGQGYLLGKPRAPAAPARAHETRDKLGAGEHCRAAENQRGPSPVPQQYRAVFDT